MFWISQIMLQARAHILQMRKSEFHSLCFMNSRWQISETKLGGYTSMGDL
jgi:hypothetical protein